MKRRRYPYRGRWTQSRLTAKSIAKLMGVEVTKAKRLLYALKREGHIIDEESVGRMIQLIRNKEMLKSIKKELGGNDKIQGELL